MKHRIDYRKLGRTTSHRKAMLNNMATSLFKHERIQTTLPKAKELRRHAEKLITRAKQDSTHSRRIVFRVIRDKVIIAKLFDEIAPRFADRSGGYTRILKLDYRMADAASTAIIELVGSEQIKKQDKKKAAPVKVKQEKDVKASKKKDVKAEKVETAEPIEAIDAVDSATASDAVFKKGKARDDAREAFMDKTADVDIKSDKKKLLDRWRKKETDKPEIEEKQKKKTVAKTEKAETETKTEKSPEKKEEKAKEATSDKKKDTTEGGQ